MRVFSILLSISFVAMVMVSSCSPKMAGADSGSILTSTLDAVKSVGGDLTALPATAAISNIEGWITKLKTMDGTASLVSNLTSLKSELGSGNIDGSKVSGLLSLLATDTNSLASDSPSLGALAGALQAGSDKLAGK